MLTIYKGRPEDTSNREPREVRVYDLLDSLGIEYDRLDHEPAMTMEVCAQIDAAFERTTLADFKANTGDDKAQHAIICKNLFPLQPPEDKVLPAHDSWRQEVSH